MHVNFIPNPLVLIEKLTAPFYQMKLKNGNFDFETANGNTI
jgi:hypothetical protein